MEEHDLVYLFSGSWIIGQNEKEYPLSAGDVFFLPAGEHHYGISPCFVPLKTGFLHFEALPPDKTYQVPQPLLEEQGVLLPTVIHCGSNPVIRRLFEEIIASFWSTHPEKKFSAPAQLTRLLCELSRMVREEQGEDPLVRAALTLLEEHPAVFLTLDQMAETLAVSRRTLTRRFREETGSSVHRYQIDYKLEKALLQLQHEPHYTVKEVAAELGFYDQFHFGKLFKERYGIPPGAVRKRAGDFRSVSDAFR